MRLFGLTRATTWPVLALTIAVYSAACVLVSTVLFQGRFGQGLGSLYATTGFLIQSTLVGGIVGLMMTGPVIFGVARCRGADVGWQWFSVIVGILVTFAFWLVMQGVLAVIGALQGQLALNAGWNESGGGPVIGGVLGQLLGNALVEETVFRGFFLVQLYLKAAERFRHAASLGIAVLCSSLLYSVTHVPNLLFIKNMQGIELLMFLGGLIGLGLLFAAIYLVTGNLFVAVGLHALLNTPAPLIHSSELTLGAVWFGLTMVILIAWTLISCHTTHSGRKTDTIPHEVAEPGDGGGITAC
jgi:membrane protease YdiL (CAAX protease family)